MSSNRMRALHRFSSAIIGVFALVHVANHLAAAGGVASHIAFMNVARAVYRLTLVEAVLLASVMVQVVTGLLLARHGWHQLHGLVARLQVAAGLYLAPFLLLHTSAILAGRGLFHLDTNFYFAAAGFHVPPFQWFFGPYYLLAVIAFFTHLGCAAYWKLSDFRRAALGIFLAVGIVSALIIVLAFAGALYPIDVPDGYKVIYRP